MRKVHRDTIGQTPCGLPNDGRHKVSRNPEHVTCVRCRIAGNTPGAIITIEVDR